MKITIIGAGKVGMEITHRLSEEGHDIVVIDRDEAKLLKIQEKMDVLTVRGSGSSAQLMRDSGVTDSDLLVAVTNSDEINMISSMTALCQRQGANGGTEYRRNARAFCQ